MVQRPVDGRRLGVGQLRLQLAQAPQRAAPVVVDVGIVGSMVQCPVVGRNAVPVADRRLGVGQIGRLGPAGHDTTSISTNISGNWLRRSTRHWRPCELAFLRIHQPKRVSEKGVDWENDSSVAVFRR